MTNPQHSESARTSEAKELYVVFRVADSDYGLPGRDVLQMETFTGATLVPGAQSFVAGIVQLRGRVVPVVDLRTRFGLPKIETTMDSRLVVVEAGGRTIGLLADRAREVLLIAPSAIIPPPRLVEERAQGFVKAVAQVGARMILMVDFEKVVGEELRNVE